MHLPLRLPRPHVRRTGDLRIHIGILVLLGISTTVNGSSLRKTNLASIPDLGDDTVMLIPRVCDKKGSVLSDHKLQQRLGEEAGWSNHTSGSHVRHLDLTLKLKVNGTKIKVSLQRGTISGRQARVSWDQGFESETWRLSTPCTVSGRVKGASSSLATLNLCHGVRGVITSRGTTLYIRPAADGSSYKRPHYVIIKKEKGPEAELSDDVENGEASQRAVDVPPPESASHRGKRQADWKIPARHMEILLVTDKSVINFHGRDLWQEYILTQMSLVNDIYHHPSLGVEINMIIVDLMILDDRTARSVIVENHGRATLDRFCHWVEMHRPHTVNFDVAVYITRENIGPAGYAPVTGMCSPLRSCSVNRDDGISSSFVIAHEIGHIFGMLHDGNSTWCDERAGEGNIMASTVQSTYDKYSWSECSRHVLLSDLHRARCLEDAPDNPGMDITTGISKNNWDLDEQCRQEFGSGYELCRLLHNLNHCEFLWCSHKSNPELCKTKRGRPIPGTACGRGKTCQQGQCTSLTGLEEAPPASTRATTMVVAGGWGGWSGWSPCSRTCGIGSRYRTRECNNPLPLNGGRMCKGEGEEMSTCLTKTCERNTDIRAELCAEHDQFNFKGNRRHRWIPLENKNASQLCKLTCISLDTQDVFVTSDDVTDGTQCSYDVPDHVCVRGKCVAAGCDGVMGSSRQADRCGVCDGDHTSCMVISDNVVVNLTKREYHQVLVLPVNARDIELIEQPYPTHHLHYIAVQDPATGEFMLNGPHQRSHSRQFVLSGAKFVYLNSKREGESLRAMGPLLAPVHVAVFSSSSRQPVRLRYRYTVPRQLQDNRVETERPSPTTLPPLADRYAWQRGGWAPCSVTCGQGEQREAIVCVDEQLGRQVSQRHCGRVEQQSGVRKRPCMLQDCAYSTFAVGVYRWKSGEWGECSGACGRRRGVQTRQLECVTTIEGVDIAVDPPYCDVTKMPTYTNACHTKGCPARWNLGPWTKCSVTCGTGIQKRQVTCGENRDSRITDQYVCPDPEPADRHICDMPACPGELETADNLSVDEKEDKSRRLATTGVYEAPELMEPLTGQSGDGGRLPVTAGYTTMAYHGTRGATNPTAVPVLETPVRNKDRKARKPVGKRRKRPGNKSAKKTTSTPTTVTTGLQTAKSGETANWWEVDENCRDHSVFCRILAQKESCESGRYSSRCCLSCYALVHHS